MAGEITFFEIGVDDAARGKAFYGALFGWSMEPGPSGEGAGAAIRTAGTPGGLHGGDRGVWPYVFFGVADLDAAVARVVELGGTVDEPRGGEDDGASPYGRFRECTDDQGSRFGLHEAPRAP